MKELGEKLQRARFQTLKLPKPCVGRARLFVVDHIVESKLAAIVNDGIFICLVDAYQASP